MAQWVVVGTGQARGPESKPPAPHKTLGLAVSVISETGVETSGGLGVQ